jgi:hypothetical protein
MFRVDLHVHSKYSGDSVAEPEEIIEYALERGLDGIAFTEHYSYEASEPVEYLKEKYGGDILILRGVEYAAREGHFLIFGLDTDRLGLDYPSVGELISRVNHAGGVIIPSHPFRRSLSIGERVFDYEGFTALEGYNGYNLHHYNMKAIEAAHTLHLPFTGGSDAHEPGETGQCYTEFREPLTRENFIDRLREGKYRGVDTRKVSRWQIPGL